MKKFLICLISVFIFWMFLLWARPDIIQPAVKIFIPVWVVIIVVGMKIFRPFELLD